MRVCGCGVGVCGWASEESESWMCVCMHCNSYALRCTVVGWMRGGGRVGVAVGCGAWWQGSGRGEGRGRGGWLGGDGGIPGAEG